MKDLEIFLITEDTIKMVNSHTENWESVCFIISHKVGTQPIFSSIGTLFTLTLSTDEKLIGESILRLLVGNSVLGFKL